MSNNPQRTETIQGLRELADFLEQHPDIPIHHGPYHTNDISFSVSLATDEAEHAEVDRIASVLGVEPTGANDSHYTATREFRGGIRYRAISITDEWMARVQAADTYRDAVQPDQATAEVA